ncbi:MAG: OmpA family protein [Bacteroidia bacterium]|nr:OmpA family protein [Bacteroidia bacterium]
MRLIYLCLAVCLGVYGAAQSQNIKFQKNLVPNGSFENYRKKSSDVRRAIPWRQIETIDYYQKPLDNDTTIERGAFQGECYTGFRFRRKYKEFLQVKLAEPLHRGTIYEFKLHIRLAYWSNAELRSFGALFTKGGYRGQKDVYKGSMVDTLCQKGGLQNGFRWFEIKGFYKADGGEKYLTIGNFAPVINKELYRIKTIGFRVKEAYYFVDDISLKRAPQFEEKVKVVIVGPSKTDYDEDSVLKVSENIKVGEKVSLSNIFFENGKYYLLPESFAELNKLSQYLIRHPEIEIRINGHSDNSGFAFKNQRISELRAREVFEYLIKKGVQNKMYFKGFGSSMPIAENNTESGRAKNRRVEFEIIKN